MGDKTLCGKKGKSGQKKYTGKIHNLQTHGGHVTINCFRNRGLDLRKADDRGLAAFKDSIVNDLGGIENIDAMQAGLLDRCVELLIMLRSMAVYAEENGVVEESGELIPCLRTSYVAYLNSFRLTLQTIYERSDKRPPRRQALKEYVSSKYGEE